MSVLVTFLIKVKSLLSISPIVTVFTSSFVNFIFIESQLELTQNPLILGFCIIKFYSLALKG